MTGALCVVVQDLGRCRRGRVVEVTDRSIFFGIRVGEGAGLKKRTQPGGVGRGVKARGDRSLDLLGLVACGGCEFEKTKPFSGRSAFFRLLARAVAQATRTGRGEKGWINRSAADGKAGGGVVTDRPIFCVWYLAVV